VYSLRRLLHLPPNDETLSRTPYDCILATNHHQQSYHDWDPASNLPNHATYNHDLEGFVRAISGQVLFYCRAVKWGKPAQVLLNRWGTTPSSELDSGSAVRKSRFRIKSDDG
jgi:hypothetical protein